MNTYDFIKKKTDIDIEFDEDDDMYFVLQGSKYPIDNPQDILVNRLVSIINDLLIVKNSLKQENTKLKELLKAGE